MRTKTWQLVGGAALVALGLLGGACRSNKPPKPPKTGPAFRYVIQLDDTLREAQAAFQVDVVPVNNTTPAALREGSVTDYFKPNSDARTLQAIARFDLSPTNWQVEVNLDTRELRHYRFPGFSHVGILADIGMAPPTAKQDPRRLLLPLDPAKWPRKWIGRKYEILVTASRGGLTSSPGYTE